MFRVAVTVLLTTMVVLFGVIAARIEPTPEALAQRAKKEEWAKIDKQAQQKAEAEELDRLRNSPKVRKKVAQLALAKQFPGECGGAADVADGSDGKIYGRGHALFGAGKVGYSVPMPLIIWSRMRNRYRGHHDIVLAVD
jgi:hypothetical protein